MILLLSSQLQIVYWLLVTCNNLLQRKQRRYRTLCLYKLMYRSRDVNNLRFDAILMRKHVHVPILSYDLVDILY